MNFDNIKERISNAADDVREGLSVLDRFILSRDIKTRTVITDRKNGSRLLDTENSSSRDYSVIKLICAAVFAFITALVVTSRLCADEKRRRIIREQRREIKELKREIKAKK